jgi:hypothetical protein
MKKLLLKVLGLVYKEHYEMHRRGFFDYPSKRIWTNQRVRDFERNNPEIFEKLNLANENTHPIDKSLPTLLKLLKGSILCKLPINPNDYKLVDVNLLHAYKKVENALQNSVETE